MKMTLSHSEIDAYLSCRRKHYYQYGLGLTTRSGGSDSLRQGLLGHAALEAAFTEALNEERAVRYEDFKVGFEVLQAHLAENPQDLDMNLALTKQLDRFRSNIGVFHYFVVLAVEAKYEVEVTSTSSLSLVVDLIVRDVRDGTIGIIDHKFVGRAYYGDQTKLMPQLARYGAAFKAEGLPYDWFAYNQFIMTKDPKHILEIVQVSEARIDRAAREHQLVSEEVLALRDTPIEVWSEKAVRVGNSMVCQNCPMKPLCIAELEDNPVEAQNILDSIYTVRTK